MLSFYRGKKVFITGHTGFKGSWLSKILIGAGAELTGFSLEPQTHQELFSLCEVSSDMNSIVGDVRDYGSLSKAFEEANPEIVIHMAAQPLVRESYNEPVETYEINTMGTVHLLECVRHSSKVQSVLNVTTDKVYLNREWEWPYREEDPLDGYDPYSNSKSCSELITHSYKTSFLQQAGVAVSTARAGNVIGGGDFAIDRIIPDCFRSARDEAPVLVRNPNSVRPYQHVLEPLGAYLLIAQKQYEDIQYANYYNIGPEDRDCATTGRLVKEFCKCWGEGLTWKFQMQEGPHEATFLRLDCSRMRQTFGWNAVWHLEDAVKNSVNWYRAYHSKQDTNIVMEQQIKEFFSAFMQ